jgi:hypothetical protein
MTWIEQPKKSRICGHIAVAVITGKTVLEIINFIGNRNGTKTKQLAKALRNYGFQCPDKCRKMPRPKLGIAQVHFKSRKLNKTWSNNWHWVAVSDDKIYDGSFGKPDGTVDWPKDWKMTSFLPVTKI